MSISNEANSRQPSPEWAPPIPAMRGASGLPSPSTSRPPLHHQIVGDGFVPGEDVEVAVVLREVSAQMDGRAHALVMESELSRGRLVILMGYTSGTTVISPVPE